MHAAAAAATGALLKRSAARQPAPHTPCSCFRRRRNACGGSLDGVAPICGAGALPFVEVVWDIVHLREKSACADGAMRRAGSGRRSMIRNSAATWVKGRDGGDDRGERCRLMDGRVPLDGSLAFVRWRCRCSRVWWTLGWDCTVGPQTFSQVPTGSSIHLDQGIPATYNTVPAVRLYKKSQPAVVKKKNNQLSTRGRNIRHRPPPPSRLPKIPIRSFLRICINQIVLSSQKLPGVSLEKGRKVGHHARLSRSRRKFHQNIFHHALSYPSVRPSRMNKGEPKGSAG